ncbi:uncharacterized protein LOC102630700 isoform X4 [Citrus sinensis]|uniref:uncharacterized protein LOC102630700 isoform X4 n=1 Tax=Citrus sinensis TaxID=2711 RepID=UPI0007635BA6|nr:uncharacterized protein LOC102630700 isoform X4 [Citrus sinensis]
MDQETQKSNRNDDNLSQVNCVISENSRYSVNRVALDTVAAANSVEAVSIGGGIDDFGSKTDDPGSSRALVEAQEVVINHDTCTSRVIGENSSNPVDGVSLETVAVRNSEQNTGFTEENGRLGLKIDKMVSSGAVVNAPETCNGQGTDERRQTDPESSGNSSHVGDVVVPVIVINSNQTACSGGENRDLEVKSNDLGSGKALVENSIRKMSKPETEKESCVIDMKCSAGGGKGFRENPDGERVCRICHLGSEQLLETTATASTTVNLIQLGCGCKDELGVAHSDCAEAWFKLKGNRKF